MAHDPAERAGNFLCLIASLFLFKWRAVWRVVWETYHKVLSSHQDEFYHLNYYTRREVLRLIVLLESSAAAGVSQFASVEECREAMFASVQARIFTMENSY